MDLLLHFFDDLPEAFLARIDAYQKELTELEMINQVRNGQLH